jgi:TRAP-type mannitol/chloroaromatic compound transport system permease small subunit
MKTDTSPGTDARRTSGVAVVVEGLNSVGTLWILLLMLLICADVVGRTLFGHPIAGVPEMVSLSIVGIVFLQLPSTLRSGRLTRSDMLLAAVARRSPRALHAVEIVFHSLGLVLMGFIVRASWPRFLVSIERKEFVGVVGHFTAPTWPIKAILIIGSTLLALQFLLIAAKHLLLLFKPGQGRSSP